MGRKGEELMSNLMKKVIPKKGEMNNKKKIENLIFLIIILIITVISMNTIWNGDKNKENTEKIESNATFANVGTEVQMSSKDELEIKLEKILNTIKGVGEVNVFISYSEGSSRVPLYDETTTTSSTEEGDSSGGTRNVTSTETKKDIIFSEKSGTKEPVTQKTTMPIVQGAIITAEGAEDATVKTKIINAVGAVTGLTVDKVQVFQMKNDQ